MADLSIHKQIEARIKKLGRGCILFPADFYSLGSTEAIKKILLRLEKKGMLIRLAFGIYLYPKQSKLLGNITPSLEEIAKAIAKRDKARIVPAGSYALNALGLSTQVPLNAVYLTDGAARKVKVGKRTILFKNSSGLYLHGICFKNNKEKVVDYIKNFKNHKFHIAGKLSCNDWNKQRVIEFIIEDISLTQ